MNDLTVDLAFMLNEAHFSFQGASAKTFTQMCEIQGQANFLGFCARREVSWGSLISVRWYVDRHHEREVLRGFALDLHRSIV